MLKPHSSASTSTMNIISDLEFTSPKRKRFPPAVSTIPPTPPPSSPSPGSHLRGNGAQVTNTNDEETPGSPRTKIARTFSSLQIEERADTAQFKLDVSIPNMPIFRDSMGGEDPYNEDEAARKRVKVLKKRKAERIEIPETPDTHRRKKSPEKKVAVIVGQANTPVNHIMAARIESEALRKLMGPSELSTNYTMAARPEGQDLRNLVDPVIFRGSQITKPKGTGELPRAYPSIDRRTDSKSRPKKRSGTPPLGSFAAVLGEDMERPKVVDPERAALTWQDEEITGHNPTDPDDDGEGMNGIGFKPTSAEAYARSQKRRQQMAEYKNREAKEARRNRIEKRRNSDRELGSKEAENSRRVRFMESSASDKPHLWVAPLRAEDRKLV